MDAEKLPAYEKVTATGILCPERLYTTRALLTEAGLGELKLSEMRRSGIVHPISIGNYRWYRGDEVIAWILSQAAPQSKQ